MHPLRSNLPPLPERIKSLPVHTNGYPIPYFVQYYDGIPDFRVMDPKKLIRCAQNNLCWICGQPLGRHKAFSAGPLITVFGASAEPPSHKDCAVFAAQACPFMLLPKSKGRSGNMPENVTDMAGGRVLHRNPGVTVIWLTTGYKIVRDGSGIIFDVGPAVEVIWYSEGRLASRNVAEEALLGSVDASIASIPPANTRAIAEAERRVIAAKIHLPT
jgi:hypothetical protein